ncbi:MAG TPA: hypothetical protein PKN36_03190 [bacterium]|nr:hypothetical protein [bacterium]
MTGKLAGGRWFELSFLEQMANIGSEVERTASWKKKGNRDYERRAFLRMLELIDLTIEDKKNLPRLKEVTRMREMLADFFFFGNEYNSSDAFWQKYFLAFAYASRSRL